MTISLKNENPPVCRGVDGYTTKAITLYRLNVQLSQRFYGMLSVFEVCFRNRIGTHYTAHFADGEWPKNQCTSTGFLANPAFKAGGFKSRKNVDSAIRSLGVKYAHDRLVASMMLGFGVNLFAPLQFRLVGRTLHRCFMARPKGTRPKDLYNQLDELLRFLSSVQLVAESTWINDRKNLNRKKRPGEPPTRPEQTSSHRNGGLCDALLTDLGQR